MRKLSNLSVGSAAAAGHANATSAAHAKKNLADNPVTRIAHFLLKPTAWSGDARKQSRDCQSKKHPQILWIRLCKTTVLIPLTLIAYEPLTDCVFFGQPGISAFYFSTRSRLLKSSVQTRKPGGSEISVATLRMDSASSNFLLEVTMTWSVLAVQ